MLLMIDNYDSFTYNLVIYFKEIGQQVEVRNHDVSLEELESVAPERIVLAPGPGAPEDAGISLAAIEHFKYRLPILGVCLGHQCIGKYFGATIRRAERAIHGKTSQIFISVKAFFFKFIV